MNMFLSYTDVNTLGRISLTLFLSLPSLLINQTSKRFLLVATPTPEAHVGIDRSLLVVYTLSQHRVVPCGTKGTGPKLVTRLVLVKTCLHDSTQLRWLHMCIY